MWTYTGDPAAISRDAVRFLVGQTSSGDEVLLADEEIAWILSEKGSNRYYAAALCADTLALRYRHAGPQSETIGDLSVTWGDRASEFVALGKTLRAHGNLGVAPFLGGQSLDDQQERAADTDLRQPAFGTKQFDYSGGSTGDVST